MQTLVELFLIDSLFHYHVSNNPSNIQQNQKKPIHLYIWETSALGNIQAP